MYPLIRFLEWYKFIIDWKLNRYGGNWDKIEKKPILKWVNIT